MFYLFTNQKRQNYNSFFIYFLILRLRGEGEIIFAKFGKKGKIRLYLN